jgi:hypothetical protein
MNPVTILREAVKQVSAMKYALPVAALVAVFVIIRKLGVGGVDAIVGAVIVLGGMVLVFVFSALTELNKNYLRLPALVLVWSVLLFAIAGSAVGVWSWFLGPHRITDVLVVDRAASAAEAASVVKAASAEAALFTFCKPSRRLFCRGSDAANSAALTAGPKATDQVRR